MGFAMVAATLARVAAGVAGRSRRRWTALAGVPRTEPGVVSHRVPETTDADCRFRLVVASASADGGAVPRPLDECVDEAVWKQATEGGAGDACSWCAARSAPSWWASRRRTRERARRTSLSSGNDGRLATDSAGKPGPLSRNCHQSFIN